MFAVSVDGIREWMESVNIGQGKKVKNGRLPFSFSLLLASPFLDSGPITYDNS